MKENYSRTFQENLSQNYVSSTEDDWKKYMGLATVGNPDITARIPIGNANGYVTEFLKRIAVSPYQSDPEGDPSGVKWENYGEICLIVKSKFNHLVDFVSKTPDSTAMFAVYFYGGKLNCSLKRTPYYYYKCVLLRIFSNGKKIEI